ncbi:MAG: hypothetical protein JJU02_07500, partial [Cryomorphaceae bacterium]|nr:hypothetical protein [Cryomorphaceae bacterium]
MKKSIYISTVLIFSLACSKEDLNIEETNQMEYTISDPFIEQYSQFGDVWLAEQDYEAFFQEIFASGYVNLYVVDQFEGDRLEIYVYPDYEGTPPQFRMGSSG